MMKCVMTVQPSTHESIKEIGSRYAFGRSGTEEARGVVEGGER